MVRFPTLSPYVVAGVVVVGIGSGIAAALGWQAHGLFGLVVVVSLLALGAAAACLFRIVGEHHPQSLPKTRQPWCWHCGAGQRQ